MTGATVTGLGRRAKYGLIDTDRGDTMIFHLGMSGRWRVDPAELLPHDHLVIETDAGRSVALNDPRRFGSVDLVATDALAEWPAFNALGPEPLGPDFTADHTQARLCRPDRVDQADAARPANRRGAWQHLCLRGAQHGADRAERGRRDGSAYRDSKRLVEAIRAVLQSAIEAGGSTLARLCAARRRTRLFLEAIPRLWPRRRAVRLRRDRQAARRWRPIDLFLRVLPALRLTVSRCLCKRPSFRARAFRVPFSFIIGFRG